MNHPATITTGTHWEVCFHGEQGTAFRVKFKTEDEARSELQSRREILKNEENWLMRVTTTTRSERVDG